jgi:phage baseplate assembly protein W
MKYINIKFPIEDDPINNFLFRRNNTTKEALLSNLTLLLLTNRWERYFNPLYGTDLLRYVFEQNDDIVRLEIENEIKQTVSRYIPKLIINRIDFAKPDEKSENSLDILINFTYTDDVFSETDVLTIKI